MVHLRASDLSKERALIEDLRPDPKAYADALDKAVGRARQAGIDLDAEQRAVEGTVIEKKEAMAAWERVFLRTARIFEDLCRLAGKDELAEQVRPSQSRPGTLETVPLETVPPADEPPTPDEPILDLDDRESDQRLLTDRPLRPPLPARRVSSRVAGTPVLG